MKVAYDDYYQTAHLFGNLYPELIDFLQVIHLEEDYWIQAAAKVETRSHWHV